MPNTYQDPGDDLLTTSAVAKLKGVHVSTVNRWEAAGVLTAAVKLPGVRGAKLYRRADVEALLTEGAA